MYEELMHVFDEKLQCRLEQPEPADLLQNGAESFLCLQNVIFSIQQIKASTNRRARPAPVNITLQ